MQNTKNNNTILIISVGVFAAIIVSTMFMSFKTQDAVYRLEQRVTELETLNKLDTIIINNYISHKDTLLPKEFTSDTIKQNKK